MALCRLAVMGFMEGIPRRDEGGRLRWSRSDLLHAAEYADWLLGEGYDREPFYGFNLRAFKNWCRKGAKEIKMALKATKLIREAMAQRTDKEGFHRAKELLIEARGCATPRVQTTASRLLAYLTCYHPTTQHVVTVGELLGQGSGPFGKGNPDALRAHRKGKA